MIKKRSVSKKLLKVVEEKLTILRHYPSTSEKSSLAALLSFLVFNKDSAGNGGQIEETVLALSKYSEESVHHFLFWYDSGGDQEEWITELLDEAISEDEIYAVMVENLLSTSITESERPEPD